jgi:hypothetical protein
MTKISVALVQKSFLQCLNQPVLQIFCLAFSSGTVKQAAENPRKIIDLTILE